MRSEGTMLDPFSPMRTLDYAQTSDTLTPAEIQLFEDKEGFSKLCRSTPLNKSDSMKKILSKSETNLIKLKDKDHKKQKKKVLQWISVITFSSSYTGFLCKYSRTVYIIWGIKQSIFSLTKNIA